MTSYSENEARRRVTGQNSAEPGPAENASAVQKSAEPGPAENAAAVQKSAERKSPQQQPGGPEESLYRPVTEKWKKALFVFNPVAGRSEIRTELVDILEILTKDAYAVTCYPTKCRGDARNIVRSRQEDYSLVICAGGDGTLDEVVSGMQEHPDKPPVPIGYIPKGSTNDFAMSLGIPMNARDAAMTVARGKVIGCDLGLMNTDTYFTYVAAFGIFTEASYGTPQDLKNMFGHMAYFMQGMMDLGNVRPYRFRIESGEMSVSDEFVFGMITNSRSVGGFADITGSGVDLGDGLFEVTLVKTPTNLLELGDIIQYFNRVTDVSDFVYRFKTSHIVLESDTRVKWTKDGEYAGAYKKVELTNLHKKLRILVPRQGG